VTTARAHKLPIDRGQHHPASIDLTPAQSSHQTIVLTID